MMLTKKSKNIQIIIFTVAFFIFSSACMALPGLNPNLYLDQNPTVRCGQEFRTTFDTYDMFNDRDGEGLIISIGQFLRDFDSGKEIKMAPVPSWLTYEPTFSLKNTKAIDVTRPWLVKISGYYVYPGDYFEYAYVVSGADDSTVAHTRDCLTIFSTSDLLNPTFVGWTYNPKYEEYENCGIYDVSIVESDLGSDGKVYMTVRFHEAPISMLMIIDVSDHANPVLEGSCTVNDTDSGNFKVDVIGDYAYVGSSAGLEVVDISSPTNPSVVGTFTMMGDISALEIVGRYAYVATQHGDRNPLKIIDISDPTNLVLIGTVAYHEFFESDSIKVDGNYLYSVNHSGLQIFDVGNPAAPVLVGTYNYIGGKSVIVRGNYAYVFGDTPPSPSGLEDGTTWVKIIDVSTPATPKLAASFQLDYPHSSDTSFWRNPVVVGNYAYTVNREQSKLGILEGIGGGFSISGVPGASDVGKHFNLRVSASNKYGSDSVDRYLSVEAASPWGIVGGVTGAIIGTGVVIGTIAVSTVVALVMKKHKAGCFKVKRADDYNLMQGINDDDPPA